MSAVPRPLFGAVTGADFPEALELPWGVILTPTYAHLMAHFMLAFERPERGKAHRGPWKSARAGIALDIEAQLHVPGHFEEEWFDRVNTIWWTVALLRIRISPFVRVPIISDTAFGEIPGMQGEAVFRVMEIQTGHLFGYASDTTVVDAADSAWISRFWLSGGQLFRRHPNLGNAIVGFDQSIWSGSHGLGLIQLWGAFELLFATSRHRKTFQLASRVSAFLEPPGETREALAREVASLYESRSDAAHGNPSGQEDAFFQSHALLRRVIIKMIQDDFVPSVLDLESLSQPGAVVGVH